MAVILEEREVEALEIAVRLSDAPVTLASLAVVSKHEIAGVVAHPLDVGSDTRIEVAEIGVVLAFRRDGVELGYGIVEDGILCDRDSHDWIFPASTSATCSQERKRIPRIRSHTVWGHSSIAQCWKAGFSGASQVYSYSYRTALRR